MDLGDALGWLALGCLIGFVLGYVTRTLQDVLGKVDDVDEKVHEIKVELDEVDDLVKNRNCPIVRDDEGALKWLTAANVALFIVVMLTAYAAFVSQQASNDVQESYERDTIARCESSSDVRVVQRETVDAIYNLATGSLARDADSPPLTDYELKQYNAYIDRVNAFRKDMYKKIKPSKLCAPYVKDDQTKPPSDPYPHFTQKDTENGQR